MTNQSSGGNDGPNGSESADDAGIKTGFSLDVRRLTSLVTDYAVSGLDTDGCVATWNEGAKRLTGYEADEILGTHYRIFFPEDARERRLPERLLERARTEGRADDEGWRLRADGERIWVREVIAPIRADEASDTSDSGGGDDVDDSDGSDGSEASDESGESTDAVDSEPDRDRDDGEPAEQPDDFAGYVRLLHDRTEQRERERELREEKAFTESVFEAQPDIVYAFDTEGNFLEWNDRFPEVTGYTESELSEMEPLDFIAPNDHDHIAEAIRRILEEDEYVTAEADLVTKDGTSIPYEFNSARITDETGAVLGFTGVGRDVSERKARERELREEKALTESIFEAQPDLLYAYDTEGNLIHWNDRLERVSGYEPDELGEMNPLDFIAPPDRDRIADAIERILTEGKRITAEARIATRDGEYVPYEFNSAPITDAAGAVLGFTGVGRNISERKARERELQRLEQLNATIRAIDETMVAAETRDEIETAIVEAFADADPYRFAVIGRIDAAVATDRHPWEPQVRAGIDADGVEGVLTSYVDPPAGAGESPLDTGTVQCYRRLPESDVDEWRTDAHDRGYGAVAVVPIGASGRTFGLLVVAAAEPTAFAEREREVLQEFGGTIGHAINAMAVRRLLYLDTVVELEFESTDRQAVCTDLSAQAPCRVTLDHVLPLTDETFVYYVTVADIDPDRVRTYLADHPGVEEFRRIDATGDGSHWELVVSGPTITELLADYGARVRSQVADAGVSSIVVQASPDVDVRDLVDAVTATYPETRLVSKRTVERPVETGVDFRRRVETELTEKQRTALEAAYYGGYFEWPTRSSDAGEIADRLGIARQTFHQHLRVAQEKLLTAYFEETPGAESGSGG